MLGFFGRGGSWFFSFQTGLPREVGAPYSLMELITLINTSSLVTTAKSCFTPNTVQYVHISVHKKCRSFLRKKLETTEFRAVKRELCFNNVSANVRKNLLKSENSESYRTPHYTRQAKRRAGPW